MSKPPGTATSEEERLRSLHSELAVGMMGHLTGLAQGLRLYDLNNAVVGGVVRDIMECARKFQRSFGEPLSLALVQSSWFAGSRLVRMSYTDYRKAEQLRVLWDELSIGEMIFSDEPDGAATRIFLQRLQQAVTGGVRVDLASENWGAVTVRAPHGVEGSGQIERGASFVIKAYCALVVMIGELQNALQSGAPLPLLRIRRILQVIAENCEEHEALMIAVGTHFASLPDPALHLANVAVYVIIIGRRLRLGRQQLLGLATAAIYHDLPKLGLGEATVAALEQPETLPTEQRQRVRRRWLKAVRELLQAAGSREELLPRLVVIYESQLEFSVAAAELYPGLPEARLSLSSRIIAAANALDLQARARRGAAPASPHQATSNAFHQIRSQVGDEVLSALLQATGFYPPGSAAVLNSGEVGVVVQTASRTDPERPRLKLVRGPRGVPIDGPIIDLQQQQGGRLCWSLHPSRLGINPLACFVPSQD